MIQYLFMDRLFKKYLDFKLQNIKWGEIKVNFKNSYEKIFKAKEGNLSSDIIIKNVFFAQKIMILIHYQAIKIFNKQKTFFSKPQKNSDTVSFHG